MFKIGASMRPLAACLFLLLAGQAWPEPGFRFSNEAGPLPVGLRVVQQYDHSRAYKGAFDIVTGRPATGERARPIQTLVWYPARPGGRALSYGDYVELMASEDDFTVDRQMAAPPTRHARALKALAAAPMRATREPPAAGGKFPLVIYAPSFGSTAIENADLCEYLVSHGYVVIASASMGARSRAMTGDVEGVEAQVGDIEFLIGYARSLPNVDFDRIAVAGFSWGGLANVAAAAKDPRIGALVSLDGTVRYENDTVKAIGYLKPARVAIPYLYVASRPATLEQMNVDRKYYDISRSFLNGMKYSDLYIVSVAAMAHEDFSSFFLRVLPATSFAQGYTRQEAAVAHSAVARYVERFLAAYLKQDAAARAFLGNEPDANGVPRHFMRVEARKPQGRAPTLENIGSELARLGFDHADEVIQALQLNEAENKPSEEALAAWARRVLYTGNAGRAAQIFAFALRLYPASADLSKGQGEALLQLKTNLPAY